MTTIDKMLDGLTSPAKLISYSKWQRALATLKWIFTRIGTTLETKKLVANKKFVIFRVTLTFNILSFNPGHYVTWQFLTQGNSWEQKLELNGPLFHPFESSSLICCLVFLNMPKGQTQISQQVIQKGVCHS